LLLLDKGVSDLLLSQNDNAKNNPLLQKIKELSKSYEKTDKDVSMIYNL
jgi:hypothetical protein